MATAKTVRKRKAPEPLPPPVIPPKRRLPWSRVLLALIVGVSATLSIVAMRRTSTTFDEIVLMAGGTRGFETGKFDLAPEHPPLTQYLYGLPIFLYGVNYPNELGKVLDPGYRYT